MRPIDADGLKKAIKLEWDKVDGGTKHEQSLRGGIRKAVRCIEEAITLDYAPVVHGEWGEYEAPYGFPSLSGFPCSVCGMHQTDIRGLYYCPNCGAKMDGGKDNG